MLEYTINVDIGQRTVTPLVGAVQGEKAGRTLYLSIKAGAIAWTIPDGTTVIARYRKPDGTSGNYDTLPDGSEACGVTSDNKVKVILAPQVCTVPGIVKLNVGLLNGDKEISTFAIDVDVQANPGVSVTSEDYVNVSGMLPVSGWTPYKYLGTDGAGNVVVRDASTGPGVASIKSVYTDGLITITETLEDGTVNTYEVTVTDGYPTKVSGNGSSVDLAWEGWS